MDKYELLNSFAMFSSLGKYKYLQKSYSEISSNE